MDKHQIRSYIYSKLTNVQRRKLDSICFSPACMEADITLTEFQAITKNPELIKLFKQLKFSGSLYLIQAS